MNKSTFGAACLLGVFAATGPGTPPAFAQTKAFVPVTQAMQADPDPADWLHISRTYDQHRFSPLNQINKGNVAQLRMAWARDLPEGTQESTPALTQKNLLGERVCAGGDASTQADQLPEGQFKVFHAIARCLQAVYAQATALHSKPPADVARPMSVPGASSMEP